MSTYYVKTKGTVFCDANRSIIGSQDTNVTNWPNTSQFIYCVAIGQDGRNPVAGAFSLQWRVSAGTFADLGSTGAIKYTTGTVLTNGNALTSGNAKVSVSLMIWKDGEEIEDGLSASIDLGLDYYSEFQFGCDCIDAPYNTTYEFQLYNNTLGSAVLVETGSMLTLTTAGKRRIVLTHV